MKTEINEFYFILLSFNFVVKVLINVIFELLPNIIKL